MSNKKDISQINWTLEPDFTHLAANSGWVLPQLMAFINSSFKLHKVGDKYSFKQTLLALGSSIKEGKVLWPNSASIFGEDRAVTRVEIEHILAILKHLPRSAILSGTQTSNTRFSASVPLFISAFKEFRNIKYSSWDWSDEYAKYFIDKEILEVINYREYPSFTNEQLIDYRNRAMMVRSGTKAGTIRKPTATTSLYSVFDEEIKDLPRLAKLMLTQLWVYDPSVRHVLAILDPVNLDNIPEPLVASEVLVTTKQNDYNELPW